VKSSGCSIVERFASQLSVEESVEFVDVACRTETRPSVMNTADKPERLPKAIRVKNTPFKQNNLINRKKWQ